MKRSLARFVALGAALLTAACAAELPPLTSPARGGPTWHRLDTPHFEMDTDVELGKALEALTQFEVLYATLREATTSKDLARKAQIVLFARESDFYAFGDRSMGGYATQHPPGDPEGPPSMVFPERGELGNRVTFLHEVDHLFNHRRFFSLPPWLDEGMADYASTLEIDGELAHLGGPHPYFDFAARLYSSPWLQGRPSGTLDPARSPTLAELLQAQPDDFRGPRNHYFYAGSWRLVQMLNESDAESFRALLGRIDRGESGSKAFRDVFGPDLDSIGKRFHAALQNEPLGRVQLRVPRLSVRSPEVHEMKEGEVQLLWAKLAGNDAAGIALADEHLTLALAASPRSTEVRFARALNFFRAKRWKDTQRELDLVLEAEPENPRFLMLELAVQLRSISSSDEETVAPSTLPSRTRELSEHLARRATTALQIDQVARAHRLAGEAGEGRQYAEVAIRLDPQCPSCWHDYAWLLLAEHDIPESRKAFERLSMLLADGVAGDARTSLVELSRAIRKAEGASDGGAAP